MRAFLWGNIHSQDFHGRKSFEAIFLGDIFRREVSWNRSNHSIKTQIFQRSQNKFVVISADYST